MKKSLLLLLSISVALYANITLSEISSKPSSRAKDFLIWQYLDQNITPIDASRAFYQIKNVSSKLFKAYAKKSGSKELQYVAHCMSLNKRQFLKTTDMQCLQIAMSPYKATWLTSTQRKALSKRFVDMNSTREYLSLMGTQKIDSTTLKSYKPSTILTVINGAGKKFVDANFNHQFSPDFIKNLAFSKAFSSFIVTVTTDYDLANLQRSLLNIQSDKLNAQTNFYLALNALRHEKKTQALHYLDIASKKDKYGTFSDKVLFWRYLITKDTQYLKALSLKTNLNIYTLYAKESLHVKVQNYFTQVKINATKKSDVNISDPFAWRLIKQKIFKTPKVEALNLAKQYDTKALQPVQAMLVTKAYSYKIHNFIMPYNEYLKDQNLTEKAFIYSLMRQESRFVPASLSTSYALGLMQMMPFVVKNLAKQLHYPLRSFDEMFIPKTNLLFAKQYLRWLNSHLTNPLFKAYAYNGGYGFLKRYLASGKFMNHKYEPFLSMELMGNSQTREYGKHVLANYVVYRHIMGDDFSLMDFLNTLKNKSDN